ncbi:excisionase [Butyrivibrio sp. AC2005]|uniref:excisionase n=1 Tax=Butyrivibrio sp. AC2005 TaxID=1280672 RepID=UPI000429F802|nr:excisionase [Butyrivibrio sp. AC2005]
MIENKKTMVVSLSEKYLLTVKEAAAYFGIGEKRIRFLVNENPDLGLHNGDRTMVHRRKFEKYIDETSCI